MITDKVGGSSAKPEVSKQSKEKRPKHNVAAINPKVSGDQSPGAPSIENPASFLTSSPNLQVFLIVRLDLTLPRPTEKLQLLCISLNVKRLSPVADKAEIVLAEANWQNLQTGIYHTPSSQGRSSFPS